MSTYLTTQDLKDNEFLKIRLLTPGILKMEIWVGKRDALGKPFILEWHNICAISCLVNRHRRLSKIEWLTQEMSLMLSGYAGYKRDRGL